MTAWRDVEVAAAEALDGPPKPTSRRSAPPRSPSRRSRSGSGSPTTTSRRSSTCSARRRGGGPLDPLRPHVLRRARHRARAPAPPRGRRDRPRCPRAGRGVRRAGARVRRHGLRRPHPRRPRRAHVVRAQARRLRVRGAPERGAAGARVRPGGDRGDLRCGRHVRDARAGVRGARPGPAGAGARRRLHAGRAARPPRRGAPGDRAGGRRAGALRDRDPPPPAHRGARGRGAVPRGPEGLQRDAAQAQPDHDRADHGPRPRAARLRPGRAGGRRAVARARHLALRCGARDPAGRHDRARLHAAPRAAGGETG